MSNKHKTKVFLNGEWIEKKHKDLVAGDVYRMYKGNGHPCKLKNGKFVWLATGSCVITKDGTATIYSVPTWKPNTKED